MKTWDSLGTLYLEKQPFAALLYFDPTDYPLAN